MRRDAFSQSQLGSPRLMLARRSCSGEVCLWRHFPTTRSWAGWCLPLALLPGILSPSRPQVRYRAHDRFLPELL
jgi:hypothetical protein